MAKVKDIIRNAYQTAQILGEGQQLSGDQMENGLQLLNESVYQFNLQQFLPWTRQMAEFSGDNHQAFIFQPVANTETKRVVPLTNKAYFFDREPKIIVGAVPIAIESLSFGNGMTWIPTKSLGFSDFQKYTLNGVSSIPNAFAFERGVSAYDAEDKEFSNVSYGVLFINRGTARPLRMVFNETLPTYKINDSIDVPKEYEALFRYDTAWRLVSQKMMPDDIKLGVKALLDPVEKLIKDLNAKDHFITYEDSGESSYYDILCPREWNRLA
jgi:hypothetical protein